MKFKILSDDLSTVYKKQINKSNEEQNKQLLFMKT